MQLRQGPGPLDAILSDACRATGSEPAPLAPPLEAGGITLTTVSHGRLKAVQCLLILTQVIGHVTISVDRQEISTTAGKVDRVLATGPLSPPHKGGPSVPSQRSFLCRSPQPRAALQDTVGLSLGLSDAPQFWILSSSQVDVLQPPPVSPGYWYPSAPMNMHSGPTCQEWDSGTLEAPGRRA